MGRLVLLALAILGGISQTGCLFTYVVRSGFEQIRLLNQRQPLEEVIARPDLDETSRRKLLLAQEARRFAEEVLHLKPTKNYTRYVQLDRPYVTYVVSAARADRLEPYHWNYPLVGRLPYRGYFSEPEARAAAAEFSPDEYDTDVRGVSAYSTLGWFEDPLLSSMLRYPEQDLVNLIIHESVHATLYIKGQADFNERLATFLGHVGTEEFYRQREGPNSRSIASFSEKQGDSQLFSQFLSEEIDRLKSWYEDRAGTGTDFRTAKTARLKEIQQRFETQLKPQLKTSDYIGFATTPLNNARLLSYKTYYYDLSDFARAFAKHENNFAQFLAYCKTLEKEKDPEAALKAL